MKLLSVQAKKNIAFLFLGIVFSIVATNAHSRLEIVNTNFLQYNGKQVALFGMGNFWAVSDPGVDFQDMISSYQSDGSNFMRMSLLGHTVAKRPGLDPADVIHPFIRSATPGANDGANKMDLTQFNPAYFQRLKELTAFAESKQVFLMFVIWDEIPLESGAARWEYNPFNPDNNINGLGLPSGGSVSKFYDLGNPALFAIQEAFMTKVLDTIGTYGNVIYSISNEYTGGGAWHKHWVDFLDTYEAKNNINPILHNELEYSNFSPNYTDLISLTTGQTGGSNNWTDTRPVVNHKTAGKFESNRDASRKIWWSVFMNGGHTSDDSHDGGDPPDQHNSSNTLAARTQIKIFRNFIEGLPYNEMVPAFVAKPGVISSGEGRVNLGEQYVIYFKFSSTNVTVDLSDATKTLQYEWFNPQTGQTTSTGTVDPGSSSFTSPAYGDSVLYIYSDTLIINPLPSPPSGLAVE